MADNVPLDSAPLPFGNDHASVAPRRHKRKKHHTHRSKGGSKRARMSLPVIPKEPAVVLGKSPPEGFDFSSQAVFAPTDIKSRKWKIARPIYADANRNVLSFKIVASATEYVRFPNNALSYLTRGTYQEQDPQHRQTQIVLDHANNGLAQAVAIRRAVQARARGEEAEADVGAADELPDLADAERAVRVATAAVNEATADVEAHANAYVLRNLNALTGHPAILYDPNVMGRSNFEYIETLMDNTPVKQGAFSRYGYVATRFDRLWNSLMRKYMLAQQSQFRFNDVPHHEDENREFPDPALRKGLSCFDMGDDPDAPNSVRVVVPLDFIKPFNNYSNILCSLNKDWKENRFLPPGTVVELNCHRYENKQDVIIPVECSPAVFFDRTPSEHVVPHNLDIHLDDVRLYYESVELTAEAEMRMNKFLASPQGHLVYPCDNPVLQISHLTHNTTMTDNVFRIPPRASAVVIAFMRSWGLTYNAVQRKPLVAWSQFPRNAADISITYAGKPLILDHFHNFGNSPIIDNDVTMDIFLNELRNKRLFTGSKADIFPRILGDDSTIQMFPFDLSSVYSDKTESLNIHMNFGGQLSDADIEVVCMSLHRTEYTYVNNASTDYKPVWSFIDVCNPPVGGTAMHPIHQR